MLIAHVYRDRLVAADGHQTRGYDVLARVLLDRLTSFPGIQFPDDLVSVQVFRHRMDDALFGAFHLEDSLAVLLSGIGGLPSPSRIEGRSVEENRPPSLLFGLPENRRLEFRQR